MRFIETGDEQRAKARAEEAAAFAAWQEAVRQEFAANGVAELDVSANWDMRELFDDEMSPAEAAEHIMGEEGLLG